MPTHRARIRVERPDETWLARETIEHSYIGGGRRFVVDDRDDDAPDRAAESLRCREVGRLHGDLRQRQWAQGQPALKLTGARQPFESPSIAEVSGVREVQAQAAKKAEVLSDRHPGSLRTGDLPRLSSWVIVMMQRSRREGNRNVRSGAS